MNHYERFIDLLILWGVLLDFGLLFVAPRLGYCMVMDTALAFSNGECGAMTDRAVLIMYVACLLGVGRIVAGLYSAQQGAWFAGMATMVLEIGLTLELSRSSAEAAPVCAPLFAAFCYMWVNRPPAKEKES